jgi:hypothetical protein
VGERRAEDAQDKPRGAVHEANGGSSETDEDVHWPGNGDGDLLGFAKGKRFGNELAEQDLKVGDEGEGYGDGDEMGVDAGVRDVADPGLEQVGDDGLADPAESEAAEGDSELHCGQEVVEVLLKMAYEAGTGPALRDHLLNARLANADQGEFGGNEESVTQDQHEDGDAAEKQEFEHREATEYRVQASGKLAAVFFGGGLLVAGVEGDFP